MGSRGGATAQAARENDFADTSKTNLASVLGLLSRLGSASHHPSTSSACGKPAVHPTTPSTAAVTLLLLLSGRVPQCTMVHLAGETLAANCSVKSFPSDVTWIRVWVRGWVVHAAIPQAHMYYVSITDGLPASSHVGFWPARPWTVNPHRLHQNPHRSRPRAASCRTLAGFKSTRPGYQPVYRHSWVPSGRTPPSPSPPARRSSLPKTRPPTGFCTRCAARRTGWSRGRRCRCTQSCGRLS
jgi:hypothetical protein